MAMLHTINKSPFERNSLQSCIDHVSSGHAILMIEDGVIGALKGTTFSDKVEAAGKTAAVYVLAPDLAARGMSEDKLIDGIKAVDYEGFVDLVTKFDSVQAWL